MSIIAYYGDSTIYGYNGETTTSSTLPRPHITDGTQPDSKFTDLIFSDEFTGSSLNTAKWSPYQAFWQDTSGLSQHYSVSNGALNVWLVHTSLSNGNLNRGVINTDTKFMFTYVYIEVQAKLGYGVGHWPGIWTYSSIHNDDIHEEIDLMEAYCGGNSANGGQTWADAQARAVDYEVNVYGHNGSNRLKQRMQYTSGFGPEPLSTTDNIYGMLWEPDRITFYFNGRRLGSTTNVTDIVDPHHMCLQEWAGSSSGSPTSSVLGSTYASNYRYCRIWGLSSGRTVTSGPLASRPQSERVDPASGTSGETIPVGGRVTKPSPAVFQDNLPQHTVYNYGINSTDTAQLIAGTNGYSRTWAAEIAQSNADVVIISFGINDQSRMTEQQYKDNLTSIYNTAVAATPPKRVIFQTPNPTDSGVAAMVTAMKEVATALNVPVIDVWQYMTSYINSGTGSLYTYIPDGLHPNQSTYTLIGNYAASTYDGLDTGTPTNPAEVFDDRVMETTTSVGLGDIALAGAVDAYRTFASVCQPGSTFYGGIVAINALGEETGQWEMGLYTYNSGNTITRTTVHSSSSGSVAVDFAAGTKKVFITLTAAKTRLYLKNTVVTPPPAEEPAPAPSNASKPLVEGSATQQQAFWSQFTDSPILEDDFDSATLDTSKWFKGIWYERTPNDNNIALVNSKLQLYPTGTNVTVSSNEQFTYGFFEAKMRLCRGTRTWPAFWLIHPGADGNTNQEVDIMEAYPGGPYQRTVPYNDPIYGCGAGNADFTIHPTGHSGAGRTHLQYTEPTLSTTYHTWGCHWRTDGFCDFYFDGRLVFEPRTLAMHKAMYLIFDIWFAHALGPYENREWRRENPFEIEYCRVWGIK